MGELALAWQFPDCIRVFKIRNLTNSTTYKVQFWRLNIAKVSTTVFRISNKHNIKYLGNLYLI